MMCLILSLNSDREVGRKRMVTLDIINFKYCSYKSVNLHNKNLVFSKGGIFKLFYMINANTIEMFEKLSMFSNVSAVKLL